MSKGWVDHYSKQIDCASCNARVSTQDIKVCTNGVSYCMGCLWRKPAHFKWNMPHVERSDFEVQAYALLNKRVARVRSTAQWPEWKTTPANFEKLLALLKMCQGDFKEDTLYICLGCERMDKQSEGDVNIRFSTAPKYVERTNKLVAFCSAECYRTHWPVCKAFIRWLLTKIVL